MLNISNKSFFITQFLCIILIVFSMLLDIPWYLKYYIFPTVPVLFMLFLAIQKINETNDKNLHKYTDLVHSHRDNKEWLEKEYLLMSQKSCHILFNKIYKSKLNILIKYREALPTVNMRAHDIVSTNIESTLNECITPNIDPSRNTAIENYNKELYNKIWLFLESYITTTLSVYFSENDIATIKQSVFEYFINERRKIEVTNKVNIPQYLSMQDIAHFFHNISELMSYYKKLKQSDFFKYLPYFIEMGDYDPQSLYRNSTRTSNTARIQLYRISAKNNIISDFVESLKKELPYNQRIIS